MSHLSRLSLRLAAGVALLVAASAASAAECPAGFPSKPITMMVGFGAGGGTDSISRAIAAAGEQQQGWTIVVDNRPGAGGGVMSASLKAAAPDGYTIGAAGTDTIAIVPYTTPDASFSHEDFDYLASAMQIHLGLVTVTGAPYDTLEDFVEYARQKGRATVAVAGINQEIAIKQIAQHFGVNIIAIPGQGAADALKNALGGHVDATTQGSQHVQQILSGDMKQLASMIDKRSDYAPEAKTLLESGLDIDLQAHTMFMAPKGLAPEIRTCLEQALDAAVNSESYGELMKNLNNTALNVGPEKLREIIEKDAAFNEAQLSKG